MSPEWTSAAAALPVLKSVSATANPELPQGGLESEVVLLFDELRAPLLRYLSSFGLSFQDSEEVVQEVFLSLFRHLDRGKSRENLRGWLFRVAHNLALKRRYRAGRSHESHGHEFAVDPAPNPEDQAVKAQLQQRVMAVVRALSDQDRRCLALRAEGLRYREIAAVLGVSLGSVSVSLTRALARISRSTGKATR